MRDNDLFWMWNPEMDLKSDPELPKSETPQPECSCTMQVILRTGCKCGGR